MAKVVGYDSSVVRRFVCTECGAIVEYVPTEVIKTDRTDEGVRIEGLTRERDALVSAIDNEMVVSHIGVFNLGDDPKIALNKLMCYAQGLGEYFAKEQLAAVTQERNSFQDQCIRMRHERHVEKEQLAAAQAVQEILEQRLSGAIHAIKELKECIPPKDFKAYAQTVLDTYAMRGKEGE